jgi:hypothetical protein
MTNRATGSRRETAIADKTGFSEISGYRAVAILRDGKRRDAQVTPSAWRSGHSEISLKPVLLVADSPLT